MKVLVCGGREFRDYGALQLLADAMWLELERFHLAAIEAERERCAQICDGHASIEGIAQRCAADIRSLAQPCKYGDPLCPCQDGLQCHYEGDNHSPVPK